MAVPAERFASVRAGDEVAFLHGSAHHGPVAAPVETVAQAAAAERSLPLSALVAAIDHARIGATDPPNLASAIRSWLMAQAHG